MTGRLRDRAELLEFRAVQLTRPRSQRVAAGSLRRVVDHVDRLGAGPDHSAVVIDRAAVRGSREAILGLADRLGRADEVSARGMILARALITDGVSSPLYGAGGGRALTTALWEIADALGAQRSPTGSEASSDDV